MIKGIGNDIIKLSRVEEALARHGDRFVSRILTPAEQERYRSHSSPSRYLAKRFAVKEAVVKALGTGIAKGISWQHIETSHDSLGKPTVHLTGKAQMRLTDIGGSHVHVTLSDEQDLILAFSVIE